MTHTDKKNRRLTGLISGLMMAGALFGSVAIASAATEPVISSINASPTSSGATITWTTDEGANAQVVYGTSTAYSASSTLNSTYGTSQSVMLSGLMPNTTYHYAVVSSDASSSMNSSTDQMFTTSAATGTLSTNVSSGIPGSTFTLNGSGFTPSEAVALNFNGATSSVNADTNGNFSTILTIPTTTVTTSTPVTIMATGGTSGTTGTVNFTITPWTSTSTPTLTLDPSSGDSGSAFTAAVTGFAPWETVNFYFNGMTNTASADTNGSASTTFTAPSSTTGNLWVDATGASSARSAGTWFDVNGNTSTTTSTSTSTSTSSTDLTTLQNEIVQLQNLITQLMNEVQTLIAGNGNNGNTGGNGNNGGSYPSSTYSGTIDSVGAIRAGTSVDFTGRNWGPNEKVQVMNNGSVVVTAQADGGGNFSTGSLPVSGTASSTETYTFTGMTTGMTRSVTVNVTP